MLLGRFSITSEESTHHKASSWGSEPSAQRMDSEAIWALPSLIPGYSFLPRVQDRPFRMYSVSQCLLCWLPTLVWGMTFSSLEGIF